MESECTILIFVNYLKIKLLKMKIIKFRFYHCVLIMLLLSCFSNKNEIAAIENNINIKIPNSYISYSKKKTGEGADYSNRVEIAFDDSSFLRLSNNIKESILFGTPYTSKNSDSINNILTTQKKRGYWFIESDTSYAFIDIFSHAEPVECSVNKKTKKLLYTFTHL